MDKIKTLLARLATMLAVPPEQLNLKETAGLLDALTAAVREGEAKDVDGRADLKALSAQVAQLRTDVDAADKALREYQRIGLSVRGAEVIPLGREERRQMLADGRCFKSDETAGRFGAAMLVKICPNVLRDELHPQIIEMAKSIDKQGYIDPAVGGAALIGAEFRPEMIRNIEATGVVFPLMRRVVLGLGTVSFPRQVTGMTFYPTAAAAKIRASSPVADAVALTAVKWAGLTDIPNEFFRNPGRVVEAGQWVGMLIVEGAGDALDGAVVNGDGSGDYGGITGIRVSANIASVVPAAGADHDAGSELIGADVSAVPAAVAGRAIQNARWVMSNSMLMGLRALRGATTDLPIFERGGAGLPPSLDGFPFTISGKFPAIGNVGASSKWCCFGDLRRSHYFGMVNDVEVAQSDQVHFDSDTTVVRGVVQVDCKEADVESVVTGITHS